MTSSPQLTATAVRAPAQDRARSAPSADARGGPQVTFRRRQPTGALAAAVAPLRAIDLVAVGGRGRLEVPTGLMNLVFGFNDPFIVLPASEADTGTDSDSPAPDPARAGARTVRLASMVSAPRSVPHVGRPGGRFSFVETAMTPMAACRVLGLPMRDLAHGMHSPGDVLGPGADELLRRMADTADWDVRLALLEGFLSDRFLQTEPCPPQVEYAWRRLRQYDVPTAGQLAAELEWSVRHLRRQFDHYVGMSPHEVTMVARLQRALRLEATGASLAEVAHGAGYHDQAHLVKSFRGLLGMTPTGYRALRIASGGSNPLTERVPGHVTSITLPPVPGWG
ncbi:MAG TPA: helix-turn-helix transcriptional regulator [Actinocrinis sp.]